MSIADERMAGRPTVTGAAVAKSVVDAVSGDGYHDVVLVKRNGEPVAAVVSINFLRMAYQLEELAATRIMEEPREISSTSHEEIERWLEEG